jgi:hypothetical protein
VASKPRDLGSDRGYRPWETKDRVLKKVDRLGQSN